MRAKYTLLGLAIATGAILAMGAAAPQLIDRLILGGPADAGGHAITNAGDVVTASGKSLAAAVQTTDTISGMTVVPSAPLRTQMTLAGFGEEAVNVTYTKTGEYEGRSVYANGGGTLNWTVDNKWEIHHPIGEHTLYESTDDVAEPDLVTTWTPVGEANPTVGTVTPDYVTVTVDDLWNLDSAIPNTVVVSGFNVGDGTYEWLGAWSYDRPVYTNTATAYNIYHNGSLWEYKNDATTVYVAMSDTSAFDPTLTSGWMNVGGGDPVGTIVVGEAGSETVQEMQTYLEGKKAAIETIGPRVTGISIDGTTTKTIALARSSGAALSAQFADMDTTYAEIPTTAITNGTHSAVYLITGRRADFLIAQKAQPKLVGAELKIIGDTLVLIAGSVTNVLDASISTP